MSALAGFAALVGWAVMWVEGFVHERLDWGTRLWVPELHFLAGDFTVHIARTARIWAAGGNPYQPEEAWLAFPYPPLVPRFFTWTSLMGIRDAIAIWLVAIAVMVAVGTRRSGWVRRELGLRAIPTPLLLAGVLWSTPVVFAMERGQCDALVLPLLAAGVAALRRGTRPMDLLAGLAFVVAAYVKYYPGLVIVPLLAMRRWTATGGFVASGVLIGLLDLRWLRGSWENMKVGISMFAPEGRMGIHPCEHSLSACWGTLWRYWGVSDLADLPGRPMAALVIGALVLAISLRVGRSTRGGALLWPLMLWVVAAATFVPPMANDYNLFFLPMAAVAVWDRRDPVGIHLLMAYLLLWWQPFDLRLNGSLVLTFKLLGLLAVGLSLCRRASESGSGEDTQSRRQRMPSRAASISAASGPQEPAA